MVLHDTAWFDFGSRGHRSRIDQQSRYVSTVYLYPIHSDTRKLTRNFVFNPVTDSNNGSTFNYEQPEKFLQEVKPLIVRSDSKDDAAPFDDPTSPQSRALEWLLNDTIVLSENGVTTKVLQRYALAVLLHGWTQSEGASELSIGERHMLME